MGWKKHSKSGCLVAVLLMGMGFVNSEWARALPPQRKAARGQQTPPPVPSTGLPDDVQLVNPDVNPTIRIPIGHSSLNWTLIKPRIRASYGWLEIDRNTVRYNMSRPSRKTKEADQGFAVQPDGTHRPENGIWRGRVSCRWAAALPRLFAAKPLGRGGFTGHFGE